MPGTKSSATREGDKQNAVGKLLLVLTWSMRPILSALPITTEPGPFPRLLFPFLPPESMLCARRRGLCGPLLPPLVERAIPPLPLPGTCTVIPNASEPDAPPAPLRPSDPPPPPPPPAKLRVLAWGLAAGEGAESTLIAREWPSRWRFLFSTSPGTAGSCCPLVAGCAAVPGAAIHGNDREEAGPPLPLGCDCPRVGAAAAAAA